MYLSQGKASIRGSELKKMKESENVMTDKEFDDYMDEYIEDDYFPVLDEDDEMTLKELEEFMKGEVLDDERRTDL